MKAFKFVKAAAIASVGALIFAGCAERADAESSEVPEAVTLLVPVPPGSSFDTFARGIAPYLQEELDTTIQIENRPGASGMVAMNELVRSDATGETLVLWQMGPMAIAQLQEREEVTYDLNELTYMGTFADSDHMLFSGVDSGVESLEDLQASEEFVFASGEIGSLGNTSQQILSDILDLNSRYVTGYADQGERLVAIDRGDADGVIGPVRTIQEIGRLDEVNPVLRIAHTPHPDFADVPVVSELEGLSEEELDVIETHLDMGSMFFTVAGPNGMSEDLTETLREGFWNAATNEEFLEAMAERDFVLNPEDEYLTGDEAAERIESLLHPSDAYLKYLEGDE